MIINNLHFLILLVIITEILASSFLTVPFQIKTIKEANSTAKRTLEELPQAPVITNEAERACITMCFGTPAQCFDLEIHGSSFYVWVFDKNFLEIEKKAFDPKASSSFEVESKEIVMEYADDKNAYGVTGIDEIYLNNPDTKIFRGNFVIARSTDSFTETIGLIGLGYTPKTFEERYSFINQLYTKKLISHKVFTQSFLGDRNGELTFGKIPTEVIEDYTHYGRCPALDWERQGKKFKNNFWQCKLSGIYYGDKYDSSKVVSFDYIVSFFSYRKRALVPLEIFEHFEKTYFSELISSGICERKKENREGEGELDLFSCKQEVLSDEDKVITLVFGDWGMRIPFYKIYKYDKGSGLYDFIFYHKPGFETFSLGRPIVRNYLMVYDFHNSQIGFYDKEYVFYLGKEEAPKVELHDFEPEDDQPSGEESKETDEPERPAPVAPPKIDISKPIEDIIERKTVTEKKVSGAYVIQTVFHYFVYIVIIAIVLFCIYAFIRYRRKSSHLSSEYFIQQAKKFEGENIF